MTARISDLHIAREDALPTPQALHDELPCGDGEAAAIRVNYGIQRVRGGGMAVRNIACLPALVGAWRQPAGGIQLSSSASFPTNRPALQRPDLLAGRTPRTINMTTIGDDLLRESAPDFGPKIEAVRRFISSFAVSCTTTFRRSCSSRVRSA